MKDTQSAEYHRALLEKVRVRLSDIHGEVMQQMSLQFEAPYKSTQWSDAKKRIDELYAEREELYREKERLYEQQDREIDYRINGYHRPEGWFATPLNRLLGPLPPYSLVVEPTTEALALVDKRFRLLSVLTLMIAIGLLIALTSLLPWTTISLYHVFYYGGLKATGSELFAQPIAVALSFYTLHLFAKSIDRGSLASQGKLWDKLAMNEEQWFRRGAENWTQLQRFTSCAAFGLVHVANVIYPIASILVVGFVVGGTALAVYLSEYKRSQDSATATLAATKFHATYNRFAIIYMAVALVLVLGVSVS